MIPITIFVHKSLCEIAIGGQTMRREKTMMAPKKKKGQPKGDPVEAYDKGRLPKLDTERTWAFEAPADVEERILRDVEFTANHPGGVPLTHEETLLQSDMESKAMVETARLSQALAGLVRERMTEPVAV